MEAQHGIARGRPGEGRRLVGCHEEAEETGWAIGDRIGIDPAALVNQVQDDIAEIKQMLAGGLDQMVVAEAMATRLDVSRDEVLRRLTWWPGR